MENKNVLELNEVTFLGMTLDNIIPWKKHTETIIGKLNKAYYIITKYKQYLIIDALFSLNSVLWLDFLW
jgi:hypothetical protein